MLDDAVGGAGQFLMISGEAGIGKTAVLAALIDEAGPAALVLRGFCWEGDGVPPYWPWSQVLRATGLPAAELGEAALAAGARATPAGRRRAAAAADAQFRLFDAVSRCLASLAADRLVLVVLDDLQWADESSLRLLGFLARTLAASRVLLLGAYRDNEASAGADSSSAGTAQQLALVGLGAADVEAMVGTWPARRPGPKPSPAVIAQLWQRSGGNPFFVRELTRLLVAQGAWHGADPDPGQRRRDVAAPAGPALHRLRAAARVGGGRRSRHRPRPARARSGGRARGCDASSLLDEARRAGVIAGNSEPRFTHDLYRETILDGLTASTRTAINLAVGRALQARSGPAARIAAHLLAAGAPAQHDAIEYSLLAAREATARLGHDDACAHYLRALQLLDERTVPASPASARGPARARRARTPGPGARRWRCSGSARPPTPPRRR